MRRPWRGPVALPWSRSSNAAIGRGAKDEGKRQ